MAARPLLDFPSAVPESQEPKRRAWHALDVGEVVERLETDRERGLDDEAVDRRRAQYGPNRLPAREPPSLARIILRQFTDPLIYILLVAAVVSFAIGSLNNGFFISAVLVLNTLIGAIQERKAESSAQALQQLVAVRAKVIRNGRETVIEATDIVPGDVLLLASGDAVSADARLVDSRELRADESLLTGESEAVEKDADASVEPDAAVGDRHDMVHAGTSVLAGRGRAVVCRTGGRTEVGAIAASLSEGESEAPPLVVRLKKLTRLIAVVVLAAIAVLAALQLFRGTEWTQVFFLAVALAVSAIPAGLPVAITVALSIASTRMAKRNVIVRQLPAVEGLGACTLIASDKTGTLTENVLTAQRLAFPGGGAADVSGQGHSVEGGLVDEESLDEELRERARSVARCGVLSNDATWPEPSGDPSSDDEPVAPRGDAVDAAFLVLGHKLGFDASIRHDGRELVAEIPYESDRRYSAKFFREDGETRVYVKGATDTLLEMCPEADPNEVRELEEKLANQGHRVLAAAAGSIPARVDADASSDELAREIDDLELLGLVGLIDPVREEVPEAVRRCRSAGVDVRMITGDHPGTGLAIARTLGLATADGEGQAVLGRDLSGDDPDAVAQRVRQASVFARVEPTQKTSIVDALQKLGHFVAVTGDGANDAPALRKANIGVSMGQGGTDVARGASDLILTDDNFASIVNGIEEGRIAYDNVRKVVWLLLATGAGEVILFFLALGFGMPLPLLPVQLLWLNLVTNGIQDVALAFEKGDSGVLQRPPRDPAEPIFDRRMVGHVLTSGAYIGALAFGLYWYLGAVLDLPIDQRRNLVLLLVVLLENVHIFSCRSEDRSAFSIPIRSNPLLIGAVVSAHGVHIASMYVPGWRDVLGIQPVELTTWLTLLPIALTLLLFDEVVKWIHRWSSGDDAPEPVSEGA